MLTHQVAEKTIEEKVTKSVENPERVLLVLNGSYFHNVSVKAAFRLACIRELPLVIVYYPFPYSSGRITKDIDANWRNIGNSVLNVIAAEAREAGVRQIEIRLQEYKGELEIDELADQINAVCVFLALE